MRLSSLRELVTPKRHGHRGQTLLIFALAFVFLLGIVGLATDSSFAYFRSIQVERAAAAAALAGVPYMPKQFNSPAGNNAFDRAILEAKRNGFDPGTPGVTVVPAPGDVGNELQVTITVQSPTFFLAALGIKPITISRTAVAGYKPPIALGQPGAQIGSEVSKLGAGQAFYFPRYKGWNNDRSEGDAFTPNPQESGAGGSQSKDVHTFSNINGIESPDVNCQSAGTYSMPCRGGYNWRIVVPDNTAAEVDIYNAANAPDWGSRVNPNAGVPGAPAKLTGNPCENLKNLPTCNTNAPANVAPYHYHEDDLSSANHCSPTCNAAQQSKYNATSYTLLQVPDLFLRTQDRVLTQTVVYPVDATNYDGTQGTTGPGSAAAPSYVNVNTGATINQGYSGALPGAQPCNMKVYHSWIDAANYDGSTGLCNGGDKGLVNRKASTCGTPCVFNKPVSFAGAGGVLGGGTYRMRVDALNNDGSFTPSLNGAEIGGDSSKGYSIRVVDPITKLPCAGCRVAAWEDIAVYTPLDAGTGVVPLFELTKDYAGATIDIDIFDVGDSGGTVRLGILDPTTTPVNQLATLGVGGSITNNGISRLGPVTSHVIPQSPIPKPTGAITPSTAGKAEYEAANGAYCNPAGSCGPEYQGSWIRITIPIPSNYNPPDNPLDYWSLQYTNTGGANDTFTYTVSARGGPVHLLKS